MKKLNFFDVIHVICLIYDAFHPIFQGILD